ncbi:hypothetical protein AAMO2058_000357500 [Amorphochlora amoebiformis]
MSAPWHFWLRSLRFPLQFHGRWLGNPGNLRKNPIDPCHCDHVTVTCPRITIRKCNRLLFTVFVSLIEIGWRGVPVGNRRAGG